MPRTRLSICRRKRRYPTMNEALDAIRASGLALRPYRCDRCFHYHLTSRTRGKRAVRPGSSPSSTRAGEDDG
ncbi:MAG: hypothetical protein IIZ38_20200 [Sphingomonas sp.]|nr:hypothetical protein [Sphingomonas sp.]